MATVDPEPNRLRDQIARIIGDPPLAEDLIASVQRGLGSTGESVADVAQCFGQAVASARVDIHEGRGGGQLLASLLQDDAELTDEQVTRCLRLVYWRMINTFQGDLAELLGMGPIRDCVAEWTRQGIVPIAAQTIWGRSIRMRSATRSTGWLKGADALVVTEDDARLIVHAVVEIKSYPVGHIQARRQLVRHLDRFDGGVKIGTRVWRSTNICFASGEAGGDPRQPASRAGGSGVLQLIVMPKADNHSASARPQYLDPKIVAIHLPWTAARLAEATYSMTAWFLGQVGHVAFQERSPWPGLALDDTGLNAAKQALYYILLRPGLPAREQHLATRLYNVYGFGYAAAAGQADILWPSPAPLGTRDAAIVADHIDTAWQHYRRCRMDKALTEITSAEALSLNKDQSHRLRWLRGMILYFTGDVAAAAQVFPQPPAAEDSRKWAMDKLTIARLAARLGNREDAEREVATVLRRDLPHRFIPISVATIQALLALHDGLESEARLFVHRAADALLRERVELDERLQQGKGVPAAYGLDPSTVSALAVELLPAAVGLPDLDIAKALLNSIEGLFAPYLLLVRDDPRLAPLREDHDLGPKVMSWIAENWPNEESS